MKFDYVTVLCMALTVYSLTSAIKLVVNVIKGRRLLKKAVKNNERIIKGESLIYKASNYIFAIVTEIIAACYIGSFLIYFRMPVFTVALVGMSIVVLAVNTVIHVIAIFKEKNVYLTEKGLIYFLGCFTFSKCRFSWENANNPEALSNTLHVYKPKDKFPFTVCFDSDIETAHKITDENAI